ncbi:TylF/MycF/NovP-related O-methyltransferase [Streptomyces sp. NPDC007861]|uniref:TylF/MycF/NovP-related O-methyltransferase n=1 Tax=Streptomyces sp. NPDC007861 TaxID=3154893 RepID=UPI0033CD20AE
MANSQKTEGAVVEIGCASGGTAAHACRLLRGLGDARDYWVYDTFDGFVPSQFHQDADKGTDSGSLHGFSASSPALVRRILRQLGAPEVELVRADVVEMPTRLLPATISACLVDVDLEMPTEAALEKVWPRMSPGGIVLVDDCDTVTSFRARHAYERFCDRHDLDVRYEHGMGILVR